jgi:hypothetical protein
MCHVLPSRLDSREATMFGKNLGGLLLLGAMISSGCGTLANLDGRPRPLGAGESDPMAATKPFGGVDRDAGWIAACYKEGSSPPIGLVGTVPLSFFFLADMPFSLVGDLATLPRTLNQPQIPAGMRERTECQFQTLNQPQNPAGMPVTPEKANLSFSPIVPDAGGNP